MSSSDETTTKQTSKPAGSKNSGTVQKVIALLIVVMAIGGGLVFWKAKYGHQARFSRITKAEMEALIKDANPMVLKQMAADPAMKEKQLEGIKELFALASAGEKEFGGDIVNQRALEFIQMITIARNYDQEIHKDAGPMPAFGFITEDQIKAFWGEGQAEGATISTREKNLREEGFKQFLDTQLEIARRNKALPEDKEPSEEEISQLRSEFAKVKIYEEEANEKIGEDPTKWADFSAKVAIQVKLQQANYMARLFQATLAEKGKVTEAEIEKYIADNPELSNDAEKRTKAEETITRLNNGEDFGTLAKDLTEDPGSKEKGGLYEGVTQGAGFDQAFEAAALALEPGKYTTTPVKTQFGYHIIKLEKKGESKDADGKAKTTYDVRHILFSTMIKDPENPMGREMPLKQFVEAKLQDEKEKKILEEVKANNPVIIEDFVIPPVSDEQIQEMMKKQQQMSPHGGEEEGEVPPPPVATDKAKTKEKAAPKNK